MSEVAAHLVVVGTIYQTPTAHQLEVLNAVAVAIDSSGLITGIYQANSTSGLAAVASAENFRTLTSSERLLPGLIDTHIHAPQWPQLGSGLDLSLERWLFENTFPLEARYVDGDFADARRRRRCTDCHRWTESGWFAL